MCLHISIWEEDKAEKKKNNGVQISNGLFIEVNKSVRAEKKICTWIAKTEFELWELNVEVYREGLEYKWEWGEGGGGICTDGCPFAGHIIGAGGQADTATAAPLPLICVWVIRNTWLPIMAPVLSCEVERGCEGRVHTSTQPGWR